ncbi:inositol monophosphatase family protein [Amycolatopsis alkalitolerans]|uniref:Inositol-1-monophosphatase n=1 Tax=Amycolatopsis alkalitolerans TaxID=2547244 RepID=A0A5C4M8R2_9PSEU|nr:inositol monophosphatase family protein [Amycolatopsis alkalitolerans]TNC28163.1 inositol monophosphatase [Amycolatopsis alkalitolerans]
MSEYLYFAEELALWAVDRIRQRRPATVSTKSGPADFVTETDLDVEREVRARIAERYPGHRIVGEEYGTSGGGEPTWYVDPVDGTTNFAHGLPWSSFSLAVADSAGALAGVVADPSRGEVFGASRGGGARLDGRPIRCADTRELPGALVLTEWAAWRPWPGQNELLAALAAEQCTTRVLGSSALSLASVAAGRASAVVLGGYSTLDVLAGVLLCREAGCAVLGRDGRETVLPAAGDGGLLAAPPALAQSIRELGFRRG